MRAIFSLADIGRSASGDVIFHTKVLPRTVEKNPRLRKFILSRMQDVTFITDDGLQELTKFEMPTERVNEFLVRMTKGLIWHFHPDYDYSQSEFGIRHIEKPDEETISALEPSLVGTKYEERGDGAIRFRHGLTDTGLSGIWLYIFYDVVWYLVVHSNRKF
jgi:hypothetical protein